MQSDFLPRRIGEVCAFSADHLERSRQELSIAKELVADLEAMMRLIATGEVDVEVDETTCEVLFALRCNDLFCPAADCEDVPLEKAKELLSCWQDDGREGMDRWVQQRRGGMKFWRERREAATE